MCEQEKAPQAFRVWLRKKRQQQLMEQRVQQLRQLELLAAAPAGRPQQDAFRQWLAVKERERSAAGRGPPQATLRSLSALYRVGRPPPAAAGDRRTPHDRLQHIYRPRESPASAWGQQGLVMAAQVGETYVLWCAFLSKCSVTDLMAR